MQRKCDLTIPACRACEAKGVQCSGYGVRLRWSSKHERLRSYRPPSASSSKEIDAAPGSRYSHPSDVTRFSHDQQQPLSSQTLSRSLVDQSTALIDYWFSHVCRLWSTFDSDVNYKRQIAQIYCQRSLVVFTAMQTMSASCLAAQSEEARALLPSLESTAGDAIAQRMTALADLPVTGSQETNMDLMYALLALGTSLHWGRSSQHDGILFSSARSLMARWEREPRNVDALHLAFFKQTLVYWEMLLSFSTQGLDHSGLRERQRFSPQANVLEALSRDTLENLQPWKAENGPAASRGTRPNSSCGISSDVVDLFGQALTLCRKSHRQWRSHGQTASTIQIALRRDSGHAWDIWRELHALDFEGVVQSDLILGYPLHTGDDHTPLDHHIHTAEAYRLAALLQLYLAFGDPQKVADIESLTCKRFDTERHLWGPACVLASEIVHTLEQMPSESGMRCMHLVLYISAAAGLVHLSKLQEAAEDGGEPPAFHSTGTQYTQLVSDSRRTILHRLGQMQRSLASRPVNAAIELINSIWSAYDSDRNANWLDVLEEAQINMLFC